MENRYTRNLYRIAKQYIKQEEWEKLSSNNPVLINEVRSTHPESYNRWITLQNLIKGVELLEDDNFNRLVEEKANRYRKQQLSEIHNKDNFYNQLYND